MTFNLRLTNKEREARAGTALPYLLEAEKKVSYLNKAHSQGGDVVYIPDEGDDFDEEDPDDDLDV